jgi:hypothetical protein
LAATVQAIEVVAAIGTLQAEDFLVAEAKLAGEVCAAGLSLSTRIEALTVETKLSICA